MTFFDKKEEVIKIELTSYGKQLLALGKLKPVYYEFFDDDIVYDSQYGGYEESSALASTRIKDETPSLKPVYNVAGAETKLGQLLFLNNGESERILQKTEDKNFINVAPLGNSSLMADKMPAWNVSVYNGEITGSIVYQTGSLQSNIQIPQLTFKDIEYKTKAEYPDVGQDRDNAFFGDFGEAGDGYVSDLNFASTRLEDGSYIKIIDDYLLLSVAEENSVFENENFDIEVFIEEMDTKTQKTILTPLYFEQKKNAVSEDNILLDEEEVQERNKILDSSYVTHYFNLYVDNEINRDVLCKKLPQIERETMFPPNVLNCRDIKGQEVDVGGLYDTDVLPEDIEDDC